MSKLSDQATAIALEAVSAASKLATSNAAIAERVAINAADTAAQLLQNQVDTDAELQRHQAVCDEQNKHMRSEMHAVIHRVNRIEKLVIILNGGAWAGMFGVIWYIVQNVRWH